MTKAMRHISPWQRGTSLVDPGEQPAARCVAVYKGAAALCIFVACAVRSAWFADFAYRIDIRCSAVRADRPRLVPCAVRAVAKANASPTARRRRLVESTIACNGTMLAPIVTGELTGAETGGRSAEKRRHLLDFLRTHSRK